MKTKLSPEQEIQLDVYLAKWLAVGRQTREIDQPKAAAAVYFMYEKILKMERPKYLIFVDSPMALQLGQNLIKNSKLRINTGTQLSSQLVSKVSAQIHSQLDQQLGVNLGAQVSAKVKSELRSPLHSQLDLQLGATLISRIREQVHLETQTQLRSELNSSLGSQIGAKIAGQLISELSSQLIVQLSGLHSKLEAQLSVQLCSQLSSHLGAQLASQKLQYDGFSFSNSWWFFFCYFGYYDYILHELFPEKVQEFGLFCEYVEHIKELHFCCFYKDIALVSNFPKSIVVDQDGYLHNRLGAAIEYRDSWAIYSVRGEKK